VATRLARPTGGAGAAYRCADGLGRGRSGSTSPPRDLPCALRTIWLGRRRQCAADIRFGGGDPDRIRKSAAELVGLAPDVIVAYASPALAPLLQTTRIVPIVFTIVADPVGAGYVESLARPGANATGFTRYDYSISAKWLELLKGIAPSVKRVGVLRDPALTLGTAQFAAIQAMAPTVGVEVTPIGVHDAGEIERGIGTSALTSHGGLVVTGSSWAVVHRHLNHCPRSAAQLPAIYYERFPVKDGGLLSYGPSFLEQSRLAAGYVDRILKGEKPADLPGKARRPQP
jgi:putative tryptophan/tyrosine transport system substrate-binding protein